MAVYISLAFYQATFGGTAVAAGNFVNRSVQASAIIDYLTFDRAAPIMALEGLAGADAATIEKIKLATCAVMDAYDASYVHFQSVNAAIKSESVGQHSVTYQDSLRPGQAGYYLQFYEPAAVYLGGTGLMYRGFNADELGSYSV